MTEKDLSSPSNESKPVEETTQPDKETGENEAGKPALPPVAQSANSESQHSYPADTEEETDRKQDESIASLAEQTDWVAKQAKWAKYQVISSVFLGAVTLGVLVYHGWIMGKQSQAMSDQTAIMKGQLESMNSGSAQTQQMIAAMQEQADATTAQATTSQALAEQNKDLVEASLAQAEAAKQSVGAAQASARAAEKGAQIAQESFYIGDRPYVFAGNMEIEEFAVGVIPTIQIIISNTGRTPALDMQVAAKMSIGDDPSPVKDSEEGTAYFEPTLPNFVGSNSILPSGEKMALSVKGKTALDAAMIEDIKSLKKFLFVYGFAFYKDALGKSHELRYCSFYVDSMEMFAPCNEFNSTK